MADDSRNAEVGARYAHALFGLAEDEHAVDAVESDLRSLLHMSRESAELRRILASPAFPSAHKGRVLAALADRAKFAGLTRKFLGVLAANGRAGALPAVVRAFLALAADRRGVVAADVTTAVALTATQRKGVAAALKQSLGKTPEITANVDPAILGGMRVRVGSKLFDSSLKTRLDHLKVALQRA